MKERNPIILFDGDCLLCNQSVQYILSHDVNKQFHFASLQSNIGKDLLKQFHFPENYINSIVLIENQNVYTKSTAVLRIAKHLNGFVKLSVVFTIIPKPIRDCIYSFIAKNRKKWFKQQEMCLLLTPQLRRRFLDENESG
ncbi:DCC1-like thiol-disulfide oxidoreductase family protein [Bacillus sp. FJAT-47783]|uniref:thiol-disulfide oxidoreductase DCC family protein n=1 Tax=Bacillus sp. FJAT-47783 TaxID=2922712 RepID=UPI001FAE65FE|nr:DCC1-like thiol-disulfide oxidoreductase family protein [Bacillus sp. FJAT-47783]